MRKDCVALASQPSRSKRGSNGQKIILDLCGGTGAWSRPYLEAGYDVRLVTLPEHDVRLYRPQENVYGVLAAPPCTEFSFAKHFHGKGRYRHDFVAGLQLVDACLRIIVATRPKFWALENPRGYLRRWLGAPAMTFEPYYFGDGYQKRTDLWGRFNAPVPYSLDRPNGVTKFSLLRSAEIRPELVGRLGRSERRAVTPAGFALAFFKANQ